MANFTFDGTSSITASSTDTVTITADPTTFTQASFNGAAVTLSFGANSITINGGTLGANGLAGVFVSGGTFKYGDTSATNTAVPTNTGNVLSFNTANPESFVSTIAGAKVAVFGGLGRIDPTDLGDSINIGGKGTFAVYGNGGLDSITQSVAFDSTSTVSVYGNEGADNINLSLQNTKASIFVSAGADADSVNVVNSGITTIFGGLDSTDGADVITFNGINSGAAGTSVIFGNGGADSITVGNLTSGGIDSTSATTVYGGGGGDTIVATGTKATISILGNEGADSITVNNTGSTFITGGNQGTDQTGDGADTIVFNGSGNALIYGNLGADSITVNLTGDSTATANVSVYGGKDNDQIIVGGNGLGAHTIFVAGGEGVDSINVTGNGGAVTIYGGISASDATDSADTITYQSGNVGGSVNIFGNGGDDTININNLGLADSTGAIVTVRGGVGNDSINVAAQADGKQSLILNGNEGSDTFTIAQGTGVTVTIGDFTAATGGDKLVITNANGSGQIGLVQTTFTSDQLQAALNAASANASASANTSKAAAVRVGGDTYLVLEGDSNGSFSQGTDQAIKLTGVTDLNALSVNTTVTSGGPVFPS